MDIKKRNEEIQKSDEHWSVLAAKYKLSKASIYRIRRQKPRQDDRPENFNARARNNRLKTRSNRKAMFGQISTSGLTRHGGTVAEEFQRELQDDSGIAVYTEMATHPVVAAVLFAVEMSLRKVNWWWQSASEDKVDVEANEFVESCFDDMSQSRQEILAQTFRPMLTYGFSLCELVYKKRLGMNPPKYIEDPAKSRYNDGKTGWRRWQFINPASLSVGDRWDFDEYGRVQAFCQVPPPTYDTRWVPMDKALNFRSTVMWDNPEGMSVLRPMYKPWYYAENMAEIEAIGGERLGLGLPIMYLGHGTKLEGTNSDYDLAQDIVINVRADEQAGVVIPYPKQDGDGNGMLFELMSPPSRGFIDFDKVVTRYEQRMAMVVLAQFIFLGMTKVGTQALAGESIDLFASSVGGWAQSVADVINRFAVPRLLALNGMELEAPPQLMHSELEVPDLKGIAEYVNKLVGSQLLVPYPELGRHLLDLANLPHPKDEAVLEQIGKPPEEGGGDGGGGMIQILPLEGEEGGGEVIEEGEEETEEALTADLIELFGWGAKAGQVIRGALGRDMQGRFTRMGEGETSEENLVKALTSMQMTPLQAEALSVLGIIEPGEGTQAKLTPTGIAMLRLLRDDPGQARQRLSKLMAKFTGKRGGRTKIKERKKKPTPKKKKGKAKAKPKKKRRGGGGGGKKADELTPREREMQEAIAWLLSQGFTEADVAALLNMFTWQELQGMTSTDLEILAALAEDPGAAGQFTFEQMRRLVGQGLVRRTEVRPGEYEYELTSTGKSAAQAVADGAGEALNLDVAQLERLAAMGLVDLTETGDGEYEYEMKELGEDLATAVIRGNIRKTRQLAEEVTIPGEEEEEGEEEQMAVPFDLIDRARPLDKFALRLKRGGPKYERETNAYQIAMQDEWRKWANKTARELANAESEEERERVLRRAVAVIVAILVALGRRKLPEALTLGLKDVPVTPELLVVLAEAVRENERYLNEKLGPAVEEKVRARLAREPQMAQDRESLAALLLTFVSRVGLYAGAFWELIWKGVLGRVGQRSDWRELRVRWVLDPNARHCPTCLEFAGEYENYEAMLARTGDVLPGIGTECGGNCRCILEFYVPGKGWMRL